MSELPTADEAREQAMRMDIINKGGSSDHVLGQKLGGSDELLALRARVAKLEAALQQSVELQSHYAELLNMHDGGQRLPFANVEAWLDRLAALKDAPQ